MVFKYSEVATFGTARAAQYSEKDDSVKENAFLQKFQKIEW